MNLQITEEWDGETLWTQEELVAFAPEIALAAEAECSEDCDCEDCMGGEVYKPVEIIKSEKTDWKCPHCQAQIQEKSLSGWNEDKRASQHTCGGWVVHPELSQAQKDFLTSLKQDSKATESEKISQPEKPTVIKEKIKFMIKDFSELTDETLKQVSASEIVKLHEAKAANIHDIYKEQIKLASDKYVADQNAVANKLKEVEDAKAALASQVDVATKQLAEVKAELEKLVLEKKALAAQEQFNGRMAHFDVEYDLEDAERQIIASDIKDLDDEAFAKYQAKMKVMMKGKAKKDKKAPVAEKPAAEEDDSKDCKASAKEAVASAIDGGKKEVVVPHTSSGEETLVQKFAKAFSMEDGFTIRF